MAELTAEQREYVIDVAVDLLRHAQPERVLAVLAERLDCADYPDEAEQDLDAIAYAVARTVYDELEEPTS